MVEHTDIAGYVDGLGEAGLERLRQVADAIGQGAFVALTYRVPLAASEDGHRRLLDRSFSFPASWDAIREEHGPGRYEVVLLGPPPRHALTGLRGKVRGAIEWALPWMAPPAVMVPRGRAQAACFDGLEWGLTLPQPRPLGSREQPSLFNQGDAPIPAFAKGSDTSYMAAEAIAPFVSELQQLVLDVVRSRGIRGATCDEVEAATDRPHQTISARINELKEPDEVTGRPQMLFDLAIRRETRHGQLAVAWLHRDVLYG